MSEEVGRKLRFITKDPFIAGIHRNCSEFFLRYFFVRETAIEALMESVARLTREEATAKVDEYINKLLWKAWTEAEPITKMK